MKEVRKMTCVKECIEFLEKNHPEEILRVQEPIDPKECDHAAWQELLAEKNRFPWIIFENVKAWNGSRWPGSFTSVNVSTFRRTALLYGLDIKQSTPFDLVRKHYEGLQKPCPATVISPDKAPIKEVTLEGDDTTFSVLPIYRNAIDDTRPGWLCPIWIARDLDTGRYNFSWHRSYVIDEKRATIRFYVPRQVNWYFEKYRAAGKNMPVVGVLGHHPAFYNACASSYSLELDETDGISGIMKIATGKELRLTPSLTWGKDLLIPADAEVVFEGEVDIKETAEAGPWCDAWRFYAPKVKMPVFHLKAINMRRQPILEGVIPKDHVITNITDATSAYAALKPRFPGIQGIFVPFLQCMVVSYKPMNPAETSNLALAMYQLTSANLKHVIIVDEETNIFDMTEIFYAFATRLDAKEGVQIVSTMTNPNDPCSKLHKAGHPLKVGGMIIDATKPYEPFPKVGKAPQEARQKVDKHLEGAMKSIPITSKWDW
jgi:UbiD family decarboxylase